MQASTLGQDPVLCGQLIRKVDARLIELLESLSLGEWRAPTIVPGWRVCEVAAHLLDTALRKMSLARDSYFAETVVVNSPRDFVDFINRINAEGVRVYGRLSPPVLIGLMKVACAESAKFHESLDPFETAAFAVSWAGEAESLNWFDTARELTERWHHQQQIRLAVNRPGIMTPELYRPVIDCLLRGLPHWFREVDAPEGTTVTVCVDGDCGGVWHLAKQCRAWTFDGSNAAAAASRVTIPQDIAWRVFTKGIDERSALMACTIAGDAALAQRVLRLTAIVG